MEFRLTPFNRHHGNEVVALWQTTLLQCMGPRSADIRKTDMHDSLDELIVAGSQIQLALHGGSVVGFVAATRASIQHLHVCPSRQRRGIGSALVRWAKAQSVGSLWLYAFEHYEHVGGFYEKHGFRAVSKSYSTDWQAGSVKYEWLRSRNLKFLEIERSCPTQL